MKSIRDRSSSGRTRRVTPGVEALEDRTVPAPLQVNTLADSVDADPTVTSLREAITAANNQVGDDTITFAPSVTGTIQLSGELPALLTNIDLQGPGANLLTVRRDSGGDYRIFTIINGIVTISGLTISNGNALGNSGGGIYNQSALTLTNSLLSGNRAGTGGGIINVGTLTVSNTTFSGNMANNNGGGIYNQGTLTLTNSTLSDNRTGIDGGGLWQFDGSAILTNVTLTANRATGVGGGIRNSAGTLTLHNTIVAGNFKGTGTARDDIFGGPIAAASSFNLIGDGTGLTGITHNANGNQIGNVAGNPSPIDPRLGLLQNNGGPTATHGLANTSPALNLGLAPGAPTTDQRGVGRQGAADIGAFEYIGPLPSPTPLDPPAPLPPEGIRLVVVKGRRKQRGQKRVQVFGVRSGTLLHTYGPFKGQVKASLRNLNGDGLLDLFLQTTKRNGKKRFQAYDALGLAPLPAPKV